MARRGKVRQGPDKKGVAFGLVRHGVVVHGSARLGRAGNWPGVVWRGPDEKGVVCGSASYGAVRSGMAGRAKDRQCVLRFGPGWNGSLR
jgi:hypothetical protein